MKKRLRMAKIKIKLPKSWFPILPFASPYKIVRFFGPKVFGSKTRHLGTGGESTEAVEAVEAADEQLSFSQLPSTMATATAPTSSSLALRSSQKTVKNRQKIVTLNIVLYDNILVKDTWPTSNQSLRSLNANGMFIHVRQQQQQQQLLHWCWW